jgi:hypothetical protein
VQVRPSAWCRAVRIGNGGRSAVASGAEDDP